MEYRIQFCYHDQKVYISVNPDKVNLFHSSTAAWSAGYLISNRGVQCPARRRNRRAVAKTHRRNDIKQKEKWMSFVLAAAMAAELGCVSKVTRAHPLRGGDQAPARGGRQAGQESGGRPRRRRPSLRGSRPGRRKYPNKTETVRSCNEPGCCRGSN